MPNLSPHFVKFQSIVQAFRLLFNSGWISLLIIAVVIVLLTMMDQGGTLVVDLLSSPFNVFLLIMLSISLPLVISHYPGYIEKNKRWNNVPVHPVSNSIIWSLDEILMGVGYITYNYEKSIEVKDNYKRFKFFNRILGVFLLWSMLYVLFSAYTTYIWQDFNLLLFSILSLSIFIGFYYWIYKLKKRSIIKRRIINWMLVFFWLTILLAFISILSSYLYGWSLSTFLSLTAFYVNLIITYSLFRNIRVPMRYVEIGWPLRLISNDLRFVKFLSFFGWFALIIFVLSQFWIFLFNPIILVICILFTFYGIIIHPLKHKMYYAYRYQTNNKPIKWKWVAKLFLYIVPVFVLIFSVLIIISVRFGNDLHKLNPVFEGNTINEPEYLERLYNQLSSNPDSTIYFIASYGGGLTANAWNSLILDTLSHFGNRNILNQTVALSGVSGGAMGQGMYMAIQNRHKKRSKQRLIIDSIAKSNFLSLDLAWLFGKDFIREWFIWQDKFSRDRAKRSLFEYAKKIDDASMETTSFRDYWAQIFNKGYCPTLLINTASTRSTRGVSCSVVLDDFENVFPGADNILDTKETSMSLSYVDVLSTTNRFPLLSPAAKIEGFGHYIDGGYFENSGMLSLYNYYNYLSQTTRLKTLFENSNIVFIQIMNSKGCQINEMIDKQNIKVNKTMETGEFSAVLNTISSIDKFPKYFNALIKSNKEITYVPIVLPFHISEGDVESYLSAIDLNQNLDLVLLRNNQRVRRIRKSFNSSLWKTAEPPLARLLSEPALNYMKATIKDKQTFQGLQF